MEDTISVIDIFNILKKRWKLIVLSTIAAAILSMLITTYLITPIYETSTKILVNQNNKENQLDLSQVRNNAELINTYRDIIKSPAILGKVINELDLKVSIEELNERIEIDSQENSQVFTLIVEDSDPSRGVLIANSISTTFQNDIKAIMNVDNVSILAKAAEKENPVPIKPNLLLNLAGAISIGLLLGVVISLILEKLDTTYKDDLEVESHLGVPIIGTIQMISTTTFGDKKQKGQKSKGKRDETFVSSIEK